MIKLLVIDDEPSIRFFYKMSLRAHCSEFVEANDGYEGIELAAQTDFDIIIMDYRMPGLDGLSAARQILERKPEKKIILISADADIQQLALENGIVEFLVKPVPKSTLVSTVLKFVPQNTG